MSIEQYIGEGYAGLFGEINEYDVYHLRDKADIVSINDPNFIHLKGHVKKFNFEPDVIFDLGANVGIFTRYARSLFPHAKIVSVEPHADNFSFIVPDENSICLNMAIGEGKIWRCTGALNGAHESYISSSTAYKDIEKLSVLPSSVHSIMPDELLRRYPGEKVIMKIDIEGNEIAIFDHEPSMIALSKVDYLVMELHWNGGTAQQVLDAKEKTLQAIDFLKQTHNCEFEHIYFYAVKR